MPRMAGWTGSDDGGGAVDGTQDRREPAAPGSADPDATDPRMRPVADFGPAGAPARYPSHDSPPYPPHQPPPYPGQNAPPAGESYPPPFAPSAVRQKQPQYQPQYPPPYLPSASYPGAPYAGAPVPAGAPAPVRTLGLAVQILLGLGLVAGAVRLWAETEQYTLVQRLSNRPRLFDQAEADASDQFVFTATTVWNVVLVATGVLFVIWFFRLRRNAGLWAPAAQRLGQGAAVWGWLPVVNFWIPFQVAQDALTATKPPGSPDRTGKGALRFWWIMWVLMVVVGFVNRAWGQQLDTLDQLRRYTSNSMFLTVVSLVAAVAAIGAVRVLTAAQERRLAVAAHSPGGF